MSGDLEHCVRCGREGERKPYGLPELWEGSPGAAVCPGCQSATWHPHCTSVRADHGYGERVDVAALLRGESVVVNTGLDGIDGPVLIRSTGELAALGVGWCDYLDQSVSWFEGDPWPEGWVCPDCGGVEFEMVHADYQQSGLKGASFDVSADDEQEES